MATNPKPDKQNSSQHRGGLIASASYQGPIPPPNMLAAYEQIEPGLASRIMAMAEKQAAHRQKMEERVIDSNIKLEKRGLNFGFILTTMVIIGAFILIAMGKEAIGIGTLAGTILVHIGAHVYSGGAGKNPRDEKTEDLGPGEE